MLSTVINSYHAYKETQQAIFRLKKEEMFASNSFILNYINLIYYFLTNWFLSLLTKKCLKKKLNT